MNIRPYVPRLLLHVFDSESKTATLGYMIFLTASIGLFHGRIIDADTWLLCTAIASTLIGGKLIGETVLSARFAKTAPKETNAPAQPTPAA